jgi:predicted AAA+ superfamily ATPase
MIYVNFEDKDAPKDIFLQDFNINRIIALLNAYSGLTITPDDTLLVFDEIQSAPQGITSLKYFCENTREYHIIAAGSFRTSLSDYRKESWMTNVSLYIIGDYFD